MRNKFSSIRSPLLLAVVAAAAVLGASRHASAATRTWSAPGSAHGWNTATNWSGGMVPGMADDVVIDGTVSNSRLDIDTNVDVASIVIQGGYTPTIQPTGAQTIRVRGAVTVNATGTDFRVSTASTQIDGNLTVTLGIFRCNGGTTHILGNVSQAGGTFQADGGTTQVDGSFTESGGTYTGNTGGLQVGTFLSVTSGTFNGSSGTIQITGALGPLSGGTFRGSSTTTTVGGNVSMDSSGTLNLNNGNTSITGSFSQSAGTTSNVGGSFTVGTVMVPKNVTMTGGSFSGGAGVVTIHGDLGMSGTGGFVASSTTTTVDGNVTHGSSGTLNLNGGNTGITGSFSQSAGTTSGLAGSFTVGTAMVPKNVTISGGSYNGGAGSVTIYGDLGTSGGGDFRGSSTTTTVGGNVTHGSSGTLHFNNGNTGITGSFSQSAGTTNNLAGTFTVGAVMLPKNVTVSGGTFLGGAGVMTLTGDVTTSGGGDLRISSSTTTVSGNMSQGSSGTLNFNNGNTSIAGFLNQSAGTITGGTGTTAVTGNLTEAGGTFTAGSGMITVGGNLSVTSGAFNGAGGMIKITGNLGPLSGGTCRLSSGTTWLDGTFNRTSTNNTFDGNGGALLFRASSARSHTLNGAPLSKVIFNDSLAGYWSLEESSNPRADNSGYANDGTLNGTYTAAATRPSVAYRDTAAITLDGTTNYISLGTTNLPAANTAQTISAWVNFSSAASTQTIVSMVASGSAIKLGLGGGNLRVLRNDGTALVQVAAPSTGAWHHVAYVYDPTLSGASRDKLYVDGTATTGTNNAHDSATPTGAYLGATSPATDLYSGSLDEVRIYGRALSARDISDFAFGRMPATGVVTHTLDALDTSSGTNVGHFVLASGIIAGSGAFTIEGDWLNYGGRFTATGSITLNGAAGTRLLLSGGYVFPNLTINTTGKYTLEDRLWVPGTLNIAGAAASFNDGGYVFHAGALTTTSGTGYQVSTGTAVLDGRSNQTITAANFNRLNIEAPNETGLVGYWKLDEGQGTSTSDVSGNANTGTVSSGASWASASSTISFDNAAAGSFDGAAGYVSLGTTLLPAANAAQSISAWIKFSSAASTQTVVAMTGSSSAIKLGLGGGNVQVLKNGGTLVSAAAPSTGSWHHVAYTWDGTTNRLYIDGAVTTSVTSHDGAAVTAAFIGATSASADFFNGQIDDVRVYSQTLTAAQVGSLNLGRYAGTGASTTVTIGRNVTIGASGVGIFIDSGVLYTSTFNVTASVTGTVGLVNSGTLHIGTGIVNYDGGLTVNPMGALLMDESGGQLQPGNNTTVIIDGTLTASNTGAIIQRDNNGQTFAFKVGSFAGATPTLNITGLAVRDTDANGMWINANTSATTTFTRFDNIIFRRGTTTYLKIYGSALYVTSRGCTFGVGDNGTTVPLPTNNIVMTGNGTADGETRAVFGPATCHATKTTNGYCQDAWTSDDDADNNGVGDTPASNGAVVQYIRGAATDTAGTIEGLPTAAFDWNTFTYYSTYVAFHDASGTADRIYVRDQTGAAKYSWDSPSSETIVGTPRWITISSTHYLYLAMASGKVYRLVDNLSSLTLDTGWTTNPFDCSCTITTPLGMDANNLYWGGTASGNKIWTLGQVSESQPIGSPLSITPTITSASPAVWVSGATTYLFVGLTGHILKVNISSQTLNADNTNPGSASLYGRIGIGTVGASTRVFAGDDGGTFWAIDPNNFTGTNKVWSYAVSGDSIRSSPYYDFSGSKVHFGTDAGKVVALDSTGAALTGYPHTPGTASDTIRSALLYWNGLLVVGTTTGKLFFLDRNNGTTGPALVRQYYFGPTEAVSGVGYDANANRYMVSTSDSTTKDGRLYYIDLIADPTSASP